MLLFVPAVHISDKAYIFDLSKASGNVFPKSDIPARKSQQSSSRPFAPVYCSRPLDVGIAGAGIAGMTTALALLRTPGTNVGRVTLVEPRTCLDEQLGGALNLNGGAAVLAKYSGIDLWPIARPMTAVIGRAVDGSENGGAVLLELNVEEAVMRSAQARELLIHDGRVMCLTVMRDKLQELLSRELVKENVTILRGHKVASVKRNESSGKCRFVYADGLLGDDEFDICIGADGLRSAMRKYITGTEPSPRYSDIRVQIAVADPSRVQTPTEGLIRQWFGDGVYCLQYAAGVDFGRTEQELLAVCFRGGSPRDENPGYQSSDIRHDCENRLRSAGMPRTVLDLFGRGSRFVDVGVYFHDPLRSWHDKDGSCTLVGDAAHAMPPFLGQGANQAIQDAHALAFALSKVGTDHADRLSALKAYESIRIPVTRSIMLESRLISNLETQAGLGAFVRNNIFRTLAATGILDAKYVDAAIPRIF